MSNAKKYLIGLFGGGVIIVKTCAVEERVLVKALKEGEVAAVSGSKAAIKTENIAISEAKSLEGSAIVSKKKRFLSKDKINDLLNFVPDDDVFLSSSNQILREVLNDVNKDALTQDFENRFVGKKYDWISVCNIVRADLGGQKKLDYKFRHLILFQYSNTYFEKFCIDYLKSRKSTAAQCNNIKEIALSRGFSNDSDLLHMINDIVKLKENS